MIRINLALKKQASYVGGKTGTYASKTNTFSNENLMPLLAKVAIPVALSIIANFAFERYNQNVLDTVQTESTKVEKEKERIQAELKRIKGFESNKAELEKNLSILRIKVDTIEKLIQGRDFVSKTLIALAQALPPEVWITEVTANEKEYVLIGATTDVGLVSDLMSKLGQTIYFKDVSLKNSTLDTSGRIANFELNARRE